MVATPRSATETPAARPLERMRPNSPSNTAGSWLHNRVTLLTNPRSATSSAASAADPAEGGASPSSTVAGTRVTRPVNPTQSISARSGRPALTCSAATARQVRWNSSAPTDWIAS